MALTTVQTEEINNMCPKSDEYSIGSRLTNITTAGAYNDGTIQIGVTAGTIPMVRLRSLAVRCRVLH